MQCQLMSAAHVSPCMLARCTCQSWCFKLLCHSGNDEIHLFLGSKNGASQLLTLPLALLQAHTQPNAEKPMPRQSSSNLQQSVSVHVQQPSILDNAAPVMDTVAFEEPQGVRKTWRVCITWRGNSNITQAALTGTF